MQRRRKKLKKLHKRLLLVAKPSFMQVNTKFKDIKTNNGEWRASGYFGKHASPASGVLALHFHQNAGTTAWNQSHVFGQSS
ncbi:hypothetical protein V5799_010116 [Amblyomma americanum]|uniref:Uncharacterized protein n=1 Tax=Amblyomma americanum TaxID=6943 RepID=A0AAQ4F9J5_AMBAM